MVAIPGKCPKCGNAKQWKEVVNPATSGIPTALGRVRIGISVKGLFARPMKRSMGFYKVAYRCHRCGFRQEYELPD